MSITTESTGEGHSTLVDPEEESFLPCKDTKDQVDRLSLSLSNFRASRWRFIIIILMGIIFFGSYFCTELPAPIQKEIEGLYQKNTAEYNLLFSLTNLPNIIFLFVLGIILDRTRLLNMSMMAAALAVFVGQGVFALSASTKGSGPDYNMALSGRFFLGLGTETENLASAVIFGYWLKGKELALAIAISTVAGRFGAICSNWTVPLLYEVSHMNIQFCLLVALSLCLFAIIAAIIYCLIDEYANKIDGNIRDQMGARDESEIVPFKEAIKLNMSAWMGVLSCALVYCMILPWMRIAPDILQQRFHMDMENSARLASLPIMMMCITAPIMGYFFDNMGYRTIGITGSTILLISGHVVLNLVELESLAVFALVLLGIGYGIFLVSIYPTIQYAVDNNILGITCGIGGCIQNITLCIFPYILGEVTDKYSTIDQNGKTNSAEGYIYASWLIVGIGVLGLLFGVILMINDWRNGGILHSANPILKRQILDEERRRSIHN